ncbi:unnamed protein product [Arabidopsis thaliana]|uniref:(thale cress) hypothetical protein n=1 Tax=Arabidopsis thaliana TaxID=3702 RepID=A0A7G2EPA7_ARATH|nr:unnamed protein product [Arabidopsis thaliana]
MDKLRLQPNYMSLDIQRHIKEQWKLVSSIGQVQTGRCLALKWLKDEYEQQFAQLRGPLIGIDGTFLKHAVKGCLFTAIGHDANNQIYHVAWVTVQSENADNWLWFLNQGIISFVKNVLPNEHRPCVKHIVKNLKKRYPNKDELKKHVWHLVWSHSEAEYRANLNHQRAYDLPLYEDVMREEPKNWCRAWFMHGSFCEDVDNNATESFNATVVKARAKALVQMMETIRRQAMTRISKRKEKIGRWKKSVSNSNHVNLTTEQSGCSCCKWPITGIPCQHAYAAVMYEKKNVEDYVIPLFCTFIWKEQYDTAPEPVRDQMYWPTGYALITAPEAPVPPGRKKGEKKNFDRVKGKHESPKKKKPGEPELRKLSRKGATIHCKSCKEAGHNAARCKKFPKEKKGEKNGNGKKTNNQEEIGVEAAGSSQITSQENDVVFG